MRIAQARDGDILDLGSRRLEVLFTPGHSPDSLCLLDPRHRLLLTGDTFYLGNLLVSRSPGALAAYARSAARLAARASDIDRLLPAHSATLLKPFFLHRLDAAFQAILAGRARPEGERFGRLQYTFDGFTVLVPDPAAPGGR